MPASRLVVFTVLLFALARTGLAADDILPGGLAKESYFLSAHPQGVSHPSNDLPVIPGELVANTAEGALTGDPSMLVLKADGHRYTSATLRFAVDSVPPGRYAVWTKFSQGGDSEQTFRLGVGEGGENERLRFSQPSKSWEMKWRKADGRLAIFPGDKVLELMVEGDATQQKNLGGFLLERTGELPAGLTAETAIPRLKVNQLYRSTEAPSRLLIVEGANASDLDPVYAALAASPQLGTGITVDDFSEQQAERLGLSPAPRVLLVDRQLAIRQIWEGPFTTDSAVAVVNDLTNQARLALPTPPIPSGKPDAPTSLSDGHPAAWLKVGTWMGPGGLSLWGLDYESQIQPNPGDPCLVERFDAVAQQGWEPVGILPDLSYGEAPEEVDSVWARGTAYAHLYVHADADTPAILHLAQTGIASHGWLNGEELTFRRDWSAQTLEFGEVGKSAATDKTDQGAVTTVQREPSQSPQAVPITLKAGWNRILLKLVMQHKKGEKFSFTTRFTDPDGQPLANIQTSLLNPSPSGISRAAAARIIPLVRTNAPFNLVTAGEPLSLSVDLGSVNYSCIYSRSGAAPRQNPLAENALYFPFAGTLVLVVTDYDGREVARRSVGGTFPDTVTFNLGPAPASGYYVTHLKLYDKDHQLVTVYPPDGFNVIGGTAAQMARKLEKKMATTYYFMADRERYKTLFFPYMLRIGIPRNVGGTNGRAPDFYKYAAEHGILLSADMWNHRKPDYLDAYAAETAPYVDSFKSFNEIDIRPDQRGTPESWVDKARLEHEAIRKYSPKARILGGSLVRPAADEWFAECLKLGLDKYYDVWDVHCYPKSPPVLEGSLANSDNESEQGVLKVMKKLGMTNTKPFWIGETGARCSHGSDARRWQADTVAKMVACTLSRPDFEKIGFLIPWQYSREFCSQNDIEAGHMPAEAAYYTASALIDGFPYKRLDFGKANQVAQFGPTTMLWRPEGTSTVKLKLDPQSPHVLVDVVGRTMPVVVGQDGTADIKVSTSPVYVLPQASYQELTAYLAKAKG